MQVVIVESPAKAKTINKYLGAGYKVYASFGHVRDLPAKDGSVNPDADFAMLWELNSKASKSISEISQAVKQADSVILATDPDREGEAISWHVLEILRQRKLLKDKKVQRVVFNAVTKDAILDAMAHPRDLDTGLVEAYLARRALDYLVGFTLSPVLWRKLPGARSAGRVQSVALRLVCERESEIEIFIAKEYWSLLTHLKTQEGAQFRARLIGANGKKINRLDINNEDNAHELRDALKQASYEVIQVEAKPTRRHPAPPFTTSTLQQEASRKLGFAPARTMQLAQKLYEDGYITYMRTDGVDMAPEAVAATRGMIEKKFGAQYKPEKPRKYTAKAKNAQEAHEAIRPTDISKQPSAVSASLDRDLARLYDLIWTRTMASQMESAQIERTQVDILGQSTHSAAQKLDLRATGQVITFDGFLALYQEGKDDEEDEDSARLPHMKARDPLECMNVEATQHFTEPPPRYTEATLIKRLEELGIGRPSTYAATMAVLQERDYVKLEKKRLVPEDKGRIVTAFLEGFFHRYVEYDFTADLEAKLDDVSNHTLDWKVLLRDFWKDFLSAINNTKELRITQVIDFLNEKLEPLIFPKKEDGANPHICPACKTGQLSLKLSKFGAFVGCSNYPDCSYTRTLGGSALEGEALEASTTTGGVITLGTDPETGEEVSVRDGRFGPYVQLGVAKGKEKPKRSSLPKGLSMDIITLEQALKLLALPFEVAKHPETSQPILVGLGRYGAYLKHGSTYANLDADDDLLNIGENRAIDLIIAKEQGKGTSTRSGSSGRDLGEHPKGGKVQLKSGRFGMYVTWNKINATLPRAILPDTLTLDEAVELIDKKIEAQAGKVLGEHPKGGLISLLKGRFGPYISYGKMNVPVPISFSEENLSLEDAIQLITEAGDTPTKKKAPAAKKGASTTKAKAPAKKLAAKKTATKKKT